MPAIAGPATAAAPTMALTLRALVAGMAHSYTDTRSGTPPFNSTVLSGAKFE